MITRIVALTLLVGASAFAQQSHMSMKSADEQAILKAETDFARESQTHGADAWVAFAADDAVEAGVGATGKDAIRAFFTKLYATPGFKLTWTPDYAKVFGDVGVTSGRYRNEVSGKLTDSGRYVTVWSRQKDGSWKWSWDKGTPDKPAAAR
jgi:ketosteroid isomerase-like protein